MKGANNMAKHLRLTSVITSLLMLAAGIFLLNKPRTSIKMICTAIAVCFLVLAATRLIAYLRLKKENTLGAFGNMVLAIILLVAAILFFVHPFSVTQIIPITLGIIILANGIILIVSGAVYRSFLPKKGLISILIGLLCVGLGWYATTNPFATNLMFMKYVGIAFIISAGSNIINQALAEIGEFRLKRAEANKVKDVAYTTEQNQPEAEQTEQAN